ncbi:hypothetical protein [Actinoplanes couchii]|uniref:Uncharacterized protein n=1 Tax=Actinoplanes couchii TaxID=403638 RepID=A0ABQ3XPC0_9ACTN|nr:hypothetical protein [Actinoplanes couchii]MDR6315883.1 hypothetical protein [Actinoplanes couchii]GID60320.1 hypothetical protein Aco03nite_087240 [Actinoplanes couchii]
MSSIAANSHRLDPEDLVAGTPLPKSPSKLVAGSFALAPILIVNVALAHLLRPVGPVFPLVALGTFGLSMYRFWAPWRDWVHHFREGLPLENLRRANAEWRGFKPTDSPLTRLNSPIWIFKKRQNEETRPRAGRGQPKPAQPRLRFQLCIAKYVDGDIAVGYSDGTSDGWHLKANALYRSYRAPAGSAGKAESARDMVRESTEILESMVNTVARDPGSTLASLAHNYPGHSAGAVMHAMRACFFWGILQPVGDESSRRLFALLSDSELPSPEAATIAVQVSGAGQLWLGCGPRALARADAQKRENRSRKISLTVGRNSQVVVQIGDHNRQTNSFGGHRVEELEEEALTALELLLEDEAFWRRPQPQRDRRVIETAVDREDIGRPAVRSAVRRLLRDGDDLVSALVGSSLHKALIDFVRQDG